MNEISKLDVSYYAGQKYPDSYDWTWTSVSAMNQQTGVIAIFRYHNYEKRNYAGCFSATPSLGFLCDARFERVYDDPTLGPFGEPQSWPFEGFTMPPVPSTDPPIEVISDPGPGEIIYVPPQLPPDDVPDDGVTLLQSGFQDFRIRIGPEETLFYKFVAAVTDPSQPIIVISTPGSDQPHTVHILVKRGSKPTIAEFEMTWLLSPSLSGTGIYADLYWYYSTGSAGEMVKISEVVGERTYYIMMYNMGRASVRNQQLTLSYYG